MIFTVADEPGSKRVYVTRYASVVSYFSDDGEGGVKLTIEPGFAAYMPDFERAAPDMYLYILHETARRLSIHVTLVLRQSFKTIASIADPELPGYYRFAKRYRERAPQRPLSDPSR